MQKLLTFMLLAFFTVACGDLPKANFSPEAKKLHVLTYNVNWGLSHPKEVVNFIAKSQADIVFIQESNHAWELNFQKFLLEIYPHQVFREGAAASGVGYLSKYPLENTKLIPPTAGWFGAFQAEIKTELGPVQLLNFHLHPSLNEEGKPSLWALYSTKKIRLNEIKGFIKDLDITLPTIIAGDFNSEIDERGIEYLTDRGFSDALSIYDEDSFTWHWLAYGIEFDGRYDHILFNKHFQCPGARVTLSNFSDHMPVEAVLISRSQ
jgi:endonuclease/exonuclease/phosphatase family metal-dependent hydrolase